MTRKAEPPGFGKNEGIDAVTSPSECGNETDAEVPQQKLTSFLLFGRKPLRGTSLSRIKLAL
jgi:hypothetical protein